MKRRLFSLLLALCLAAGCALPALAAAGFDETVLQTAQDILRTDYTDQGVTAYYVASLRADERWFWTAEGNAAVQVYPCVLVREDGEIFTLCFLHDARLGLKIQNVTFTIGGRSYRFSGVSNDEEWYEGGEDMWWISELACVELDAGTLPMLEQLVEHRTESVQVSIEGENVHLSITLGQPEIDGIIHLYNLYRMAGGMRDENLQRMPAGSGTACAVQP